MARGVSKMTSHSYPTYEDAAREYLAQCMGLMQTAQDPAETGVHGARTFQAEILVERAKEIASDSAAMIQLAETFLESTDPDIREGIRYQFIVQSAVELLLGIEILQISGEKTGTASTAANKATWGAALTEAVSAVDKAFSSPIGNGVPADASYRASEYNSAGEAVSGLTLAIDSAVTNISRRVQELGGDIACDLLSGTSWDEVVQCASLPDSGIRAAFESIYKGDAGMILWNVHRKISALTDRDAAGTARIKIKEWLGEIGQANGITGFNAAVDRSYQLDVLRKKIRAAEPATATLESLNSAADLVKRFSDRFIFLIGRMRRLEDTIRLGESIDDPQFRVVKILLQTSLLAGLVQSGQNYIDRITRYPDLL
jgi:hypothetical protein